MSLAFADLPLPWALKRTHVRLSSLTRVVLNHGLALCFLLAGAVERVPSLIHSVYLDCCLGPSGKVSTEPSGRLPLAFSGRPDYYGLCSGGWGGHG